jgi:hypothetical protein
VTDKPNVTELVALHDALAAAADASAGVVARNAYRQSVRSLANELTTELMNRLEEVADRIEEAAPRTLTERDHRARVLALRAFRDPDERVIDRVVVLLHEADMAYHGPVA